MQYREDVAVGRATKPKTKSTPTRKTSTKRRKGSSSSAPSSRAGGKVDGRKNSIQAEAAAAGVDGDDDVTRQLDFPLRTLGHWEGVKKNGRPKDSPDVWTKAHLEEVAGWIYVYADTARFPSIAGFCRYYGVSHQRLYEFDELAAARNYLDATVADQCNTVGLTATKDVGPRVTYAIRRAANTGRFSLVEKSENVDKIDLPKIVIAEDK